MDILRKSLKIYLIGTCLFVILSMMLTAALYFTELRESWAAYGIFAVLGLSSLAVTVLESKTAAKRGLLAGLAAGLLFFVLMLALSKAVFP